MPVQQNLSLWRGNAFSCGFAIEMVANAEPVPLDLSGSEIVFIAKWTGGEVRKSSADDDGLTLVDATDGRFDLAISMEEGRTMPNDTPYEIERRIDGGQETLIFGRIKVAGGLNDD